MPRGDTRNQVAALERAEHQPGDLVDIWYDLPNKDTPGWRGPAQIASVQETEGNVRVRSQWKTLDRRSQEVRAQVPYLVYLSSVIDHKAYQFDICRKEVENLLSVAYLIVGLIFHHGAWNLTPRTRTTEGGRSLDVALAFATHVLHIPYVAIVRACRGISCMFA